MKQKTIYRLLVLVAVTVALMLIGRYTPLGELFSFENFRSAIQEAGAAGVVIFIAVFALGTLMNIPGIVFLVAGLLVYGNINGMIIGFSGALISVILHFYVVRMIGGKALTEVKRPLIAKMLHKLDEHPVRTVVIMRLLLFISPPVNYALALSSLRSRDFVIGSILGIPLPLLAINLAVYFAREQVVAWMG